MKKAARVAGGFLLGLIFFPVLSLLFVLDPLFQVFDGKELEENEEENNNANYHRSSRCMV